MVKSAYLYYRLEDFATIVIQVLKLRLLKGTGANVRYSGSIQAITYLARYWHLCA